MTPPRRNRRRARGGLNALAILVLALAAAAFAALPAMAATPAQLTLIGTSPEYDEVTITLPDGSPADTSPGLFQLDVTVDGVTERRIAYCLDSEHVIGINTPYEVSLQTAADDPSLGSPANGQIAWLIQETPALLAAAPDPELEAGAIQIAIWIIGDQVDLTTPTDDAVLNARAAALVAASAGRGIAGPVGIQAAQASTCANGPGTTLTVTGTPGTTASLAVTAGQGALSASQVTFDAAGRATVTLTSATVGSATVTVTALGADLTRATRVEGEVPQETGFLVPRTYTASVSVAFTDCTPPPPVVVPLTPPVVIAQTPRLGLTKRAPASVRSGRAVRYTLVVRNPSRTVARNVVLRDRLPSGLAFSRSSVRPSGVGRVLSWNLGTLRPGSQRVVRVWLTAPATLRGARTNVATVSATRTRAVRAAATVRFTPPIPRRIQPAVTG